ncbi:MAG: hypothetical protein Tp1124DCM412261_5 [Prokaryotic dsDNA virus sp.]|nr:MAG: hypothetical protein Tp1123DCM939791_29 [Prokaryotic dsDNA virus sp.]QDP59837.1 MAG: hypothetical protein Tp1124DCM412261_5 [Prokaryotic dsDNA virus sp.]|tara:strand:- start:1359 stop:1694 length:336 start_codon:yes stop_codon:yes gene_type:complete
MDLKDNPIYKKIDTQEQFYKYLKLLFEDLEFIKSDKIFLEKQNQKLQKEIQMQGLRIHKLEERLEEKSKGKYCSKPLSDIQKMTDDFAKWLEENENKIGGENDTETTDKKI